jgi:GLPGLI family protein
VFADPLKMVPKTEDGKMTGQFKVKPNKSVDSVGDIIYYDKTNDTIYTREKMIEEYVVFIEKMPQINWNITDETRLIKNYKCYKATTYFRGRDYTAWFTTDVPIIAAPWKFNGLPGLILDIYDNKNQVKIYAESIEYPSKDIVNNFYATGIKVTLQEYLEYRNFEFGKKIKNIQIMVDSQPGIENTTYKPKPVTRNILYGIEKSSN